MGSTPTPYQKSFASASILPTCGEIESSARLAVCADWFGVASSLGLAPGRRNAKGWVSLLCPECGRGGACDLDLKAGGWKCFKCSGKGHLGALVGQGAARFERAEPEPERAELSRLDVGAALRALGGRVVEGRPQLGAEDFASFSRRCPSAYFLLGVRDEARGIVHPIHSPRFDVDERCIPLAVGAFSEALVSLGRS